MLFLCVITISCSSNKYITITTQQFRGFVKYDYPEGVDVKAFEFEYNRYWKADQEGVTKVTYFFNFDTLKKYGSFNRWRRFGRSFCEECKVQSNRMVRKRINKILKYNRNAEKIRDSLLLDANFQGSDHIGHRIITHKKQEKDTFYLGYITFPVTYHDQHYLIKDNKCFVMRNDFMFKIRHKPTLFRRKWSFDEELP